MRITESQLRRIIREEAQALVSEGPGSRETADAIAAAVEAARRDGSRLEDLVARVRAVWLTTR